MSDILQHLASKTAQDEIKTAVDNIKTNVTTVNTNVDSVKTSISEVKDDIATVLEKVENIGSGSSGDVTVLSNDELVLASVLLRGDTDDYEWVLRQKGIGKVLNNVYKLNSEELAFCETIEDISADIDVFNIIKSNADCYNLCMVYSPTFANASALFDYPDELTINQGKAYSTYSVGDKLTLLYGGVPKEFTVIAKGHFNTGRVLIAPSQQSEKCVWDSTETSNNYLTSGVREYMNSTVLSNFTTNVQNAIIPCTIICHTSHNATTSTTCTDKIIVLSLTELYGANSDYLTEGTKIDYFSSSTVRTSFNYNNNGYYTRTPSQAMGPGIIGFKSSGSLINTGLANTNYFFFAFEV